MYTRIYKTIEANCRVCAHQGIYYWNDVGPAELLSPRHLANATCFHS